MIKRLAEHRVAANLTMIVMLLLGLWAIRGIPSQLDPPMAVPQIWVNLSWRGASAEDVESLVTLPIEQQLKNLPGLKRVNSRTGNGYTVIAVQFDFDVDMTQALDQVKQRVANIRNLPAGIEPPEISRQQDLENVAVLTLTGPGTVVELIPIAREMERQLLDRGIERIEFEGLPQQEIALLVGAKALHALGLSHSDIAAQIARLSQDVPAGSIGRGQGVHQLRSLEQQRDPQGFEQLQVEVGDQLLRFDSFGSVERRSREGQPTIERGGQPAITLSLYRATSSDAYQAETILQQWLTELRPGLPPGVAVAVVVNVWDLLGTQLQQILGGGFSVCCWW